MGGRGEAGGIRHKAVIVLPCLKVRVQDAEEECEG